MWELSVSKFASLAPRSIIKDMGVSIGNTNRRGYRYVRNEVPSPIPRSTPAASGDTTSMAATQFLFHITPLYF